MAKPWNKITMADGEVLIDLTDATLKGVKNLTTNVIESDKILKGTAPNENSAYGNDGYKMVGTCTYDADTKDATATKDDIILNKTAYVNGVKITGEMPINTTAVELTDATGIETLIPRGYYDGTVKAKAVDSDLVASNIKAGVSILGVLGEFEGDEVIVSTGDVDPYVTDHTYVPGDYHSTVDPTKVGTAFSSFKVKAIAKTEEANTKGTTLIIGKVDPNPPTP